MTLTGWWLLRLLAGDRRVRYACTGGLAAGVYYAAFAAGWLLLSRWLPYLAVALLANLVTALLTYPIYRRMVFRTGGAWLAGLVRFYLLSVGGLLFMVAALPVLVEVADLHVLVAQAIVIAGIPLVNYQLNRTWAFRPAGAPAASATRRAARAPEGGAPPPPPPAGLR